MVTQMMGKSRKGPLTDSSVCDLTSVVNQSSSPLRHERLYETKISNVYDKLRNNAQKECKKVSEYFTQRGTFLFDTHMKFSHSEITLDTLMTRVKLLYSMVKRVHELIRPKDNDEQLFGEEEVEVVNNRNVTHTIRHVINTDTYTNYQNKAEPNFTRSVFARSGVKTSTKNIFLSKLTKHLQLKKKGQEELSFSAQVSELFNDKKEEREKLPRSPPMLSGRYSLRKLLLTNQRDFPFMRKLEKSFHKELDGDETGGNDKPEFVLTGSESLQISEILHQINDLTTVVSTNVSRSNDSFAKVTKKAPADNSDCNSTDQQVNVNSKGYFVKAPFKRAGRNTSVRVLLEDAASTSNSSNSTQPSNFTTLERISDLDLVESRLNILLSNSKFETPNTEFETHL